jgi:predicted MPP superfamily phosphohydrolase
MEKKKWTENDLAKLTSMVEVNSTSVAIARVLDRTQKSVERKIESLGLKRPPRDLEMPEHVSDAEHWRDEFKRICRELTKERKRNKAVNILVEDVKEIAPVSYKTAPQVKWPARKPGKSQSAVLILSDTHIGQVVTPEQTQGFGEYNFDTFLNRMKRLEDTIHSILSDHTNTKIDEMVVAMLGDMLHGALNHAEEAGQRNVVFNQFYAGAHVIAQFLRNMSTLVPKMRIYTTVGNHTRWGTQHKMPAKNRFSNFDMMLYAMLEALTSDIENIEWNLSEQPFAQFDVQGFKFWASHGEELKGGDKAIGIPVHSMGRRISSTTQMMASQGLAPINYYVFGHHHKSMTVPHANGEMICNGCFAGIDDFAFSAGFTPVAPIQRFFLVHPVVGRAATYDIQLRLAKPGGAEHYEVPSKFKCE